MAKTTRRAQSAKRETAKRVNNKQAKAETAQKQAKPVETVTQVVQVACLPAVVETAKASKVEAKDVLKSANVLKARVKTERRGANVTIRLIAEAAANGDTNAINVLCALCDVPREALFAITIDKVREAVNAYYPYYIETEGRKVSVKASSFWYTTASTAAEEIEDAAKRVTRGFCAVIVDDYLEQLITAAKARAKGVQPRRVDADAVYSDNKLSTAAAGITSAEIDEAKQRRAYSDTAANVWRKDRNGFYI